MQTATNGHAEDAYAEEGYHETLGCAAAMRALEVVDTEPVEELRLHCEKQVFRVTSMNQGFEIPLLDRYLKCVSQMVSNIVSLGAYNPVEHHRCPRCSFFRKRGNLVKRLVAEEDPVVWVGDWVAICLCLV